MRLLCCLWTILALTSSAAAQTASLRGQVTDESGAVIPGAKITLNGPPGLVKSANADSSGTYSFAGLPPGDYAVQASAPELVLPQPAKITLKPGPQSLDLQLKVALPTQKVTV